MAASGSPARPQLIRAMNEQLLLDHIRSADGISRADLARISGLAKNTVSLALANLERANLVRVTGVRTGVPGPAAVLYEVRPESGFVLGLDVGSQFLRGAIADITGTIRARASRRTHSTTGRARVADLVALGDSLLAEAGLSVQQITQTVLGSPGVYDMRRDHLSLAGALPGWEKPAVLARAAAGVRIDTHDRERRGRRRAGRAGARPRPRRRQLRVRLGRHRHRHGSRARRPTAPRPARRRRRDRLPAAGRRHVGRVGREGRPPARQPRGLSFGGRHRPGGSRRRLAAPISARQVFAAADRGDDWAVRVVADEAQLVARAVCAVITVVDPELIVLGGGIGQAAGFVDAVASHLRQLAPVVPELKVSALGADAVVDGCLAAGVERAWQIVTAALPTAAAADDSVAV